MTAAFALAITAIMLLACGGLIWYSRDSAERNADALLSSAAGKASRELGDTDEPGESLHALHEQAEELTAIGLVMLVVDAHGHTVWQSQRSVPSPPYVNKHKWRVTTFQADGNTFIVGMPWARTDEALEYHSMLLVVLGLFVVIVASIGAWALVGRTLSPIALLSREANTASADSLRISLSEPSRDAEIVELVATLNGLLGRLSETAASKGRFYSAASHELRTPLQALSGHLELSLSKPRSSDEYHAVVDEAYVQTRRLISLVQDLLMLNQLDVTTSRLPRDVVNLTELCERMVSQMAPVAAERKLRIEESLQPDAEVPALPTHADMLIRNLVENAVKYASEGGQVRLRLIAQPERTRLEIYDECPPIPIEDLDQLFEPFYRPDLSRQSATGGNGLGLAICKALAIANGWRLSLHQEDSGIRAVVEFGPGVQSPADK
jgi:signal transduction histidine kinase